MKSLFGNGKSIVSILAILIFVLGIDVTGYALPVSQRTPQVRDAIVAAVPGVNNANNVTTAHLAAITYLDLSGPYQGRNISLKAGDLDGLTALTSLTLRKNGLTSLPSGIFDDLTTLTDLDLTANELTSLPSGIFDNLTTLTHLNLGSNDLTALPSNIFDNLIKLTHLYIDHNDLTSIPAGIFDNLTTLTHFSLHDNGITSLPADIFKNLTKLLIFSLRSNKIDDVSELESLTSLTTLYIDHNPISDYGPLRRLKAAIEAIEDHPGLTLDITIPPEATNTAPVFTDGTSTTRTIAENTASGEHIGTALTATDVDNDTLTYTLSGTDATAFEIDATTGQLKTKAVLDYETKAIYTVTVTVSDGSLTDTITVTINITNINELSTTTASCKVGDVLNPGQSCTYPGTDAVFSVLGNGTAQWHIPNLPAWLEWINQTSISGSLRVSTTINGQAYHFVAEQVGTSWEIKEIGDDRSDPQPETPEVPEPPIVTEKPIESDYDYIEGPWLWMIAPGGDIDTDNLSEASEGVITEPQIAQNGVNEGDHFDTLQWTSGRLLPTTVCGIFLCSSDNVINVVREIGLTNSRQLSQYSAYALINISSPRDQNDVLMGVGSDDSIKVWLNGSVVYKNDVTRRTTGIQNRFPVNLNAGNNLLLIKVCNHGVLWSNNDWGMFFKLYLDTQDYTLSLPMGDGNSWQPVPVVDDPTNTAPVFTDGATATRTIAENTAAGQHIGTAITATDADNDTLTYTLGGTDAASFGIDATTGQLKTKAALDYETKNTYTGTITVSDGSLTDTITVTITVTDINEKGGDDTNPQPDTPEQPGNTGGTLTLSVSTAAPLTEATLHGGIITLTLSGGTYESSSWRIRDAVTVSGISGVTVETFDVDRVNDPKITVELTYDGNMSANGTLTLTVGAGAIKDYNGAALTRQVSVPAVTESITASTASPLKEATLDESVVTLTVSGRKYERWNSRIRPAVSVSGISGVTVRSFDIDRESDTEVTVELTFDGNMNTDGTLTFTVGADAIAGYNGPALTAQVSVSASDEPVVDDQTPDPPDDRDTDPPEQPQQPEQPGNTGGTPTLAVSTAASLTEATLNGAVVSLNLSGGMYERAFWNLDDEISVSGITGVSYNDFFDVARVSDTKVNIELSFESNMTANGTLTFTVKSGAIVGYTGPNLTAQISVSAVTESVTALTAAPLTEATLDGSVVTLTLSGRKYARSIFDIRRAVSVSGITSVTMPWHDPDKESDTEITIELEFDGDMTTDGTLTFTVGADAIAGYNGPALTAQITVTADRENVLLANFPNPFNPETWIPYQLAKPADVTLTIYAVNGQVVRTLALGHQPAGIYQTRSRAAYWDGKNAFGELIASGVYFYTLTVGDFTATRKMLIRK